MKHLRVRFMLQQMTAVAGLEAGLISTRTKATQAAAKARGKKLGGNRGTVQRRWPISGGNQQILFNRGRFVTALAPQMN